MESSGSCSDNKVQICIIDSWKLISLEMKKYCDIVNLGKTHISALLAHDITLSNVVKANIKGTDLYRMDPEISLKLQFNIKREILSEERAIGEILQDLQTSYTNIMGRVDKIFNVYKESNLSTDEMSKASITSLSAVEMLELIDKFKRLFIDCHDGRKYSLDCYHFTKDHEKVSSVWDTTEMISLKEKLDREIL